MTYRQLAAKLALLSPSQLDDDVTIYTGTDNKFYPAGRFYQSEGDDVLHDGHFYLTLELDRSIQ